MKGMLEGIKVVDFSMAASGPACTKLLAEWGADVMKIEQFGGEMERYRPFELFEWTNLNKRDIVINAKAEEGRKLIYKMCETADMFVTNYRTKALVKLGLDYESIKKVNPKIIYGSITGYGLKGPDAELPGYDVTAFWARTGLLYEMCEKDTSPLVSPLGVGDYALACTMAGGMLAAYTRSLKTGEGAHVSTSLYGCGLYMNQWYLMRPQGDPSFVYPTSRKEVKEPMSNCFKTKDGKWFQMTVFDFDRFFPALMKICGREDVLGTKGFSSFREISDNHLEVTKILDEGFAKYNAEELYPILEENSFAFSTINLPDFPLTDAQAWDNNYLFHHKFRDGYDMVFPASPIKFADDEVPVHDNAPLLGEHTVQIMKEYGYSDSKIREMIDGKIVEQWKE